MELISILTFFLLAIANASPHPRAAIPGKDIPLPTPTIQHKNEIRQNGATPVWTPGPLCTYPSIDSLVSSLLNPPESVSFDGEEFCSLYLQPHTLSYILTTTTGETITEVSTTHTPTSTTTTYSSVTTTTLLCASPRPSALCNLTGNAYDYFQLGWVQDVGQGVGPTDTLEECYNRCLQTEACNSILFSSPGPPYINTCDQFQARLEGLIDPNGEGGGGWWERGCVGDDLLPEGCSTPPPPPIPPKPRNAEEIQNRDLEKRDLSLPPYIEPITIAYLGNYACSCIVTSASPTTTDTTTYVYTLHSSTSTTTTQVDVDVSTSYLSLSTAYSTV